MFLAVTGAEALYADLGHFGRRPIVIAWFALVFPCLLLNYFGQGAYVLDHGEAVANPFFQMLPDWSQLPMVLLATAATVIASQAVITGAFSLTRQAVSLNILPRMTVLHTSETQQGQIYMPLVNGLLMIAVVLLVLGFGSSSHLGAAYGIAVTGEMLVTVGPDRHRDVPDLEVAGLAHRAAHRADRGHRGDLLRLQRRQVLPGRLGPGDGGADHRCDHFRLDHRPQPAGGEDPPRRGAAATSWSTT